MGVGRSSSPSSVPSSIPPSPPRTLDSSSSVSKLEMSRFLAILCLASVAVAQDSIYSTEEVEPGQYVHNPEWDLTPYQLWKRKQAAKKALQPTANSLPKPAAAAPQKSRFQNFKQVEQQRSAPVQQQPRREQAYFQPAPQQPQHQTYTQEYIFEANNNAQRIYSYTAPK